MSQSVRMFQEDPAQFAGALARGSEKLQNELPALVIQLAAEYENDSIDMKELCTNCRELLQRIEELCGRSARSNRIPMISYEPIWPVLTYVLSLAGAECVTVKLTVLQILRNLSVEEAGAVKICETTLLLELLHQNAVDEVDSSGDDVPANLRQKALTVFFHLSDVEANRQPLLQLEQSCAEKSIIDTCCRPLLQDDSYMGTRALMFVAILVGSEEHQALISSNPQLINQVVALLHNVLYDEQFTKKYGWKVTHPLYPLRKLCIADKNKVLLATKETLMLLMRVLEVYDQDSHRYIQSLAIGTMLELSFRYDDGANSENAEHENLMELFDWDVRAVLFPLLEPHNESLPEAEHLMNRLQKQERQQSSENLCALLGVDNDEEQRHIMMSYSWNAKKEHVIELSKLLRAKGYDVWRDEDGSDCVPPMGQGGVDEIMALAVEKAALVVICVSRPYKESANCRMEGQYANRERKAGNTDLAFIMMEDTYTTVSDKRVDGWLGIMIGDALWYPAWEQSHLKETCERLTTKIEKLPNCACLKRDSPVTPKPGKADSHTSLGHSQTVESLNTSSSFASLVSFRAPPGHRGSRRPSVEDPPQRLTQKSVELRKDPEHTIPEVSKPSPATITPLTSLSVPSVTVGGEKSPRQPPFLPHVSSVATVGSMTSEATMVYSQYSSEYIDKTPSSRASPASRTHKQILELHHSIKSPSSQVSRPQKPPDMFPIISEEEKEFLGNVDFAQFTSSTVQKWLREKKLDGFCRSFKARGIDGRGLIILSAMRMPIFLQYVKNNFAVKNGEALSLYWEFRASNAIYMFEELEELSNEDDEDCRTGSKESVLSRASEGSSDQNNDELLNQHDLSVPEGQEAEVLELGEQRLVDLAKLVTNLCFETLESNGLETKSYKSMEHLQRLVKFSQYSDDTDVVVTAPEVAPAAEAPSPINHIHGPVHQEHEADHRLLSAALTNSEAPVQDVKHFQPQYMMPPPASSGMNSFDRAWRAHRGSSAFAGVQQLKGDDVLKSSNFQTAVPTSRPKVFGGKTTCSNLIDRMNRSGWTIEPGRR
eukprot:gnl/MRDRNA2_/MRDRNA2_33999_c0_seq2.p1 gnl/MRDRNA2_/MRDRNA2_33999_c0~~gnl/MRDRNA2_/MRDRNA2_33999_c0_seq2.p1  ORF type:complete len:1053 (-),score=198.52 gnl/MRDRNA2_/MRDRNA2_33999_c0_seq2:238-3396(-)